MTDFAQLLRRAFHRLLRNPHATAKGQTRKLIKEMESHGLRVVSAEELAATPVTVALEPAPLSRTDRARILYHHGEWEKLYALKRASKVSWERLGFSAKEEMDIIRNNPA